MASRSTLRGPFRKKTSRPASNLRDLSSGQSLTAPAGDRHRDPRFGFTPKRGFRILCGDQRPSAVGQFPARRFEGHFRGSTPAVNTASRLPPKAVAPEPPPQTCSSPPLQAKSTVLGRQPSRRSGLDGRHRLQGSWLPPALQIDPVVGRCATRQATPRIRLGRRFRRRRTRRGGNRI